MSIRSGREPRPDADQAAPAEGDAGHAVTTLYEMHYRSLVRLAALLVSDLATAEDIVQESFAAVQGSWRTLPDADAALCYLRADVSLTLQKYEGGTREQVSAMATVVRPRFTGRSGVPGHGSWGQPTIHRRRDRQDHQEEGLNRISSERRWFLPRLRRRARLRH